MEQQQVSKKKPFPRGETEIRDLEELSIVFMVKWWISADKNETDVEAGREGKGRGGGGGWGDDSTLKTHNEDACTMR
jgi:hypothetical protein